MVDSDLEMFLDRTADRVASVTLESDSFPETPDVHRSKHKRRRRIVKKSRPSNLPPGSQRCDEDGVMDVDTESEARSEACGSKMEWERDIAVESELSSDSECTDFSDADDEESNDEQHAHAGKRPETAYDRRPGGSLCSGASFHCATPRTLMRRLERFVRDDSQSEIEIPCLTKPHELRRLIQHLGLEKSNRHRGTIVLRKVK